MNGLLEICGVLALLLGPAALMVWMEPPEDDPACDALLAAGWVMAAAAGPLAAAVLLAWVTGHS